MVKMKHKICKGGQSFRQRLLLATLSSTPILIEEIHSDATFPGLRPHEVSFLHLLEKITDDCSVVINDTGTKVKYNPGSVIGGKHMGGKDLEHDCGLSRSIGYFLEPLILLSLFGKKPLCIKLKGITNDPKDPSVDTFRSTTLRMFKRFGVPEEGLDLKIVSRGVAPKGGGEVILTVPLVHNSLKAVTWINEGQVKRIRGVSFSTRVSVQFENTMIHAARGIFNRLLPDVHIFTDHKAGAQAGKSPGYGISLVAETITDCFISADTSISYGKSKSEDEFDDEVKKELMPPEEVGEHMASVLLAEIEQGGVVDSTHQGLLFLLCALCPPDVSKVRVGKLSPYGIQTLRNIKDFLDVKFDIKPEPVTGTVMLKCKGCGLKNLSRKIS